MYMIHVMLNIMKIVFDTISEDYLRRFAMKSDSLVSDFMQLMHVVCLESGI